MFEWFARRRLIAIRTDERRVEAAKPSTRAMTGKYVLLYKYLENRYANSVVLWWTDADGVDADPRYSDAWRLASRTALPNLPAQIVAFDRAS